MKATWPCESKVCREIRDKHPRSQKVCAACAREINRRKVRAYYYADPKRHLERLYRWRRENPEKARAARRQYNSSERRQRWNLVYYLKNRKVLLARARAKCAALEDSYLKNCLCAGTKLRSDEIPANLLQAQRAYLEARRVLYGKTKRHHPTAGPIA